VLTVEHSFNEVCDLMARVLGGKHRLEHFPIMLHNRSF
jgi:hypothetical protein